MSGEDTCKKCGLEHPRCKAHSRRTKKPCGQMPVQGQDVCRNHGGSSPQAKAAAARRAEQAQAAELVVTLGLPRDVSPQDALLEEVHRTAGAVAWLQEKVREVEPDALGWGMTEFKDKTGGDDWGKTSTFKATPSIWYELYTRERKHLVEVCAAALKAGVEERRVRLAESQGELLAQVIRNILTDLDLTAAQQQLVPDVVPRHLRAVAG